ncbi:sensor histidine kinase [Rhodospirillum sp. A1_3_36]|uniref:sensor histidine kinase n=1 Tax=Rhodospirillum sp. A1_3_36 TaxID=3391666 RepID=UPI0039A5F04B
MDRLAALFRRGIEAGFVAAPFLAVLYLWFFQVPPLIFKDVFFHEVAVGFSSVLGLGIGWIALLCYRESGELFALFLALGLTAFSVLYAFHGAFTRLEGWNPWMFLLYAPVSRFALSACLVAGLVAHDWPRRPEGQRLAPEIWGPVAALVMLAIPSVALLALAPFASSLWVSGILEGGALAVCLIGILRLVTWTRPFPMRGPVTIAFCLFLESSTVFFLTEPWTHVWWAAHLLSAAGFMVLAHGILRAYLGGGSFSALFSEEEMLADLARARDVQKTLSAARDAAEMANRAKTEFLASMSHELRTPLNAVIGFAEVMKMEVHGPLGSETYLEYADNIGQSGAHLLSLINDILDVSRVEAGRVDLFEERVDLEEVIQEALTLMRGRAQAAEVDLMTVPAPDPVFLWGDARRLKQILLNLLSNAVKFTAEGGWVRLSWWVDEKGIFLKVSDNGIGIAPGDLKKVMIPFGQVDSGFTRKYDGSGLGLPLAKAMVELHGGALILESTKGLGTQVTVRLPLARLRDRSARKAQDDAT